MGATIEDVARRAQVSVATVSRAIRGLPNVAPSTRKKVLLAASELHYIADPYASRLAGGRTLTIGFVVPLIGQWYYSKLFSGVETVVAAAGYDLLPFTLSGPGGVEGFLRDLPFRKRVEGLVVVDTPMDRKQMQRILDAGAHVVTLGFRSALAPSLTIDNAAAARIAVGHLTGLGHRRIAFVGGARDDPFRPAVPADRYSGYVEALAAADVEVDPALGVSGNFSLEGGSEAMHALLALDRPPTAVFACSDEMAIGAMQVARDAGLRIPEELSVVGFDDHDVSEYIGLTTVRQDVIHQGERCAQMLLGLLEGDDDGGDELQPTRLIVRRTTGPPVARTAGVR